MKFNEIKLLGFGKLVNRQYQFGPGLNLIYGKNEAGKSTLQRALLALLFGFYPDGRITKEAQALVNDLTPWDAKARYGGALIYSLNNNEKFQVTATFGAQPETRLVSLSRKTDVSNQYRSGRQGRLFFAEEQLGVSKEVFENTCFVRQAELISLDSSASSITDALMRLSASASQESTSAEAITALEVSLKEDVGTARAYKKPLALIMKRIEDLEAEREKISRQRQELFNQTSELIQLEASCAQLQQELDKASYLQILAVIQENEKLLSTVEDAEKHVKKFEEDLVKNKGAENFPIEILAEVQRSSAQYLQKIKDRDLKKDSAQNSLKDLVNLAVEIDTLYSQIDPNHQINSLTPADNENGIEAYSEVLICVHKKLELLRTDLGKKQQDVQQTRQRLGLLLSEGIKGISAERERWHSANLRCNNTAIAVQKVRDEWQRIGISEEELLPAIDSIEKELHKWEVWAQFRVDARDEVVRYSKLAADLKIRLQEKQGKALETEKQDDEITSQMRQIELRISRLTHLDLISKSVESQIMSLMDQLEKLSSDQKRVENQLNSLELEIKDQGEQLSKEQTTLTSALYLDIVGLTSLRQQWISQSQLLGRVNETFVTAEQEWLKVKMSEERLKQLQKTVNEIETGVRPTPKARKGCWARITRMRVPESKEVPSEILIYAQIQPIYVHFSQCREELSETQRNLENLKQQIRINLGDLISEPIREEGFQELIDRVQTYKQNAFYHSQKITQIENYKEECARIYQRIRTIEQTLRELLSTQGITREELGLAVNEYKRLCSEKDQYEQDKSSLEKLKLKKETIDAELRSWKQDQKQFYDTQTELLQLLRQTGIDVQIPSLEDGIHKFEQGLKNFHEWQRLTNELDHLKNQVKPIYDRLINSQTELRGAGDNLQVIILEIQKKYFLFLQQPLSEIFFQELEKQIEQFNQDNFDIQQIQKEIPKLEYQFQDKNNSIRNWQDQEADVQTLEKYLINILIMHGYTSSLNTIMKDLNEFESDYKSYENWVTAKRGYEQAIENLTNLQRNLENTKANLENFKIRANDLRTTHPSWSKLGPSNAGKSYEQTVQKFNRDLLSKREEISRLQQSLVQLSNLIRHPAEIEEDLAFSRKQLMQLQNYQYCLENAKNELEQATIDFQRQFAPRLESKMMASLAKITTNRYTEVKVEPSTLDVSLLTPEKKELIPARLLSTGTKDLVFLSLRIGIVQLMSGSGESIPLLLDDPFVQFDKDRQSQAFEYLNILANEMQVLLFTKEEELSKLFINNYTLTNNKLIEVN